MYLAVMGNNPSWFDGRTFEGRLPVIEGETQEKRPVEEVTWFDAVEFCNKLSIREGLEAVYTIDGRTPSSGHPITNATVTVNWSRNGYRLPTEAQWEYACRAGTTTAYNTGDTISDDTGWYVANSANMTREVGKKPANAWGLYDMHGNVFEWCWDWYYDTYPSVAETDPVGPPAGSFRVLRGGSWYSGAADLRSASRLLDNPHFRFSWMGFRLVRPREAQG